MARPLRMTLATEAVLRVLLDDPTMPRYGFDVAREAGIATGSLYPILARLEQMGWVGSTWEEQGPGNEGRPRRRYYRLTGMGETCARQALHESLRRKPSKAWRPAGGLT